MSIESYKVCHHLSRHREDLLLLLVPRGKVPHHPLLWPPVCPQETSGGAGRHTGGEDGGGDGDGGDDDDDDYYFDDNDGNKEDEEDEDEPQAMIDEAECLFNSTVTGTGDVFNKAGWQYILKVIRQ